MKEEEDKKVATVPRCVTEVKHKIFHSWARAERRGKEHTQRTVRAENTSRDTTSSTKAKIQTCRNLWGQGFGLKRKGRKERRKDVRTRRMRRKEVKRFNRSKDRRI